MGIKKVGSSSPEARELFAPTLESAAPEHNAPVVTEMLPTEATSRTPGRKILDALVASAKIVATIADMAVPSANKLRLPPPVIVVAPALLDPSSCVKRQETPTRHRSGAEDTETVRPMPVPLLLYGPLLYVPGTERIMYTPAQSDIIHRPGMSPARIEPPVGHTKIGRAHV